MNKLMVAICDTEEGYRNRFVSYLVEHKAEEIMVHAFSSPENFLSVIGEIMFDIVLLGSGFDLVKEVVKEHGMPVLCLKDYRPEVVAEEGGYQTPMLAQTVEVFRYQPMDAILHEVQALVGKRTAAPVVAGRIVRRMEVIGVYSPIRHEMQVPFSTILASMLAEKRKVLYMNLMGYSGFMELFGLDGACDIGEIILRIRSGRLISELFWKWVYEMGEFSYIPPFHNAENLRELTWSDYTKLLTFLEEETDFEAIIIDFDDGVADLLHMLESCNRIYCPIKQGFLFSCQINQFLSCTAGSSEDALAERIFKVELPYSARGILGGMDVLRQLKWSEFGDYVRGLLAGEV